MERHHLTRAALLLFPCAALEQVAFRLADFIFPELNTSPDMYFGTSVGLNERREREREEETGGG